MHAIHFAVRRDWPELVSIFDKAMDSISESQKLAINNKWIELDTDVDYWPLIRFLSIIAAVIAIVMSVSFFWIMRLKNEIRERKKIQADLEKAKAEADEANALKSSFLARMSHEIRTPLNSITGMSYLLKNTEVSLTQRMYISNIEQAANNMLSIINDILDFSKIEAGKIELEITSFSIDQVILNVVNIISHKIEEQGIKFRLHKDSEIPVWFYGDPRRIEQILLNLLNNAVKFTREGEVSLYVGLISAQNGKCHISFTVIDTGIGMTENQIENLFKPFVQGDITINRRFGGSGLGLSIVKSLVDLMNGRIEVSSAPGKGSTFTVYLTLDVDKEKEKIYGHTIYASRLDSIRVLILEKQDTDINMLASYLGRFGMHYKIADSEESAVRILETANSKKSNSFDLLIVDFETPAVGGFGFVKALRGNGKIKKLPEILMPLPMNRLDLLDRLKEHGVDMGIVKPIIPSVLLNGILDIFDIKIKSGLVSSELKEAVPEKPDAKYRVLLAEDNKTNQLIVSSLLQPLGIETIVAGDGKEAVELYKQNCEKIDLILMDLHMPVMNGYEASGKIREISKNVPYSGIDSRCDFRRQGKM